MSKTYKYNSDWVVLKDNDPMQGKGQLVEAKAGDMILWDSRTVHGGTVYENGLSGEEADKYEGLARLSFTVCMTQRNRASKEVLEARRQAFEKGYPTSHWPHEFSK